VRSSGTYAAVALEDLLEADPIRRGKQKRPTHFIEKLITELDADSIEPSLGPRLRESSAVSQGKVTP
jgi:hypothetical protein